MLFDLMISDELKRVLIAFDGLVGISSFSIPNAHIKIGINPLINPIKPLHHPHNPAQNILRYPIITIHLRYSHDGFENILINLSIFVVNWGL